MVELSLPKDSLKIIEANRSLISREGARSIWSLEIPPDTPTFTVQALKTAMVYLERGAEGIKIRNIVKGPSKSSSRAASGQKRISTELILVPREGLPGLVLRSWKGTMTPEVYKREILRVLRTQFIEMFGQGGGKDLYDELLPKFDQELSNLQ